MNSPFLYQFHIILMIIIYIFNIYGSNLFHYNFSFFVQSFCSHIHLFSQINFEITLFVVFIFPEKFEASMNFTLFG